MERKLLQLLVFLVLVANLLSSVFIIQQTQLALRAATAQATAQNDGQVAFCLNQEPSLTVPCSPNMSQDAPYSCQLIASDPDSQQNLTYFLIPQPPDNVSIFNVSSTGLINFTPTNDDRGNHSVIFGIDDGSTCENAYAYELFNYTVENVNDPPYLIKAIPSQTFRANTTLYAFFLDDYFADPDEDPLSYAYLRGSGEVQVNVTINPDSSVVLTSSGCGKAHFQFIATDPGNLSTNSNAIQVEVTCVDQTQTGNESGDGGTGGGTGGGASSLCEPEMVCLSWSDCYPNGLQVQVCKDKNGCSEDEVKFYKDCVYLGPTELCPENWLCEEWGPCRPSGTQNRSCHDLAECTTARFRPVLEQECTYEPRCDDHVQNGDEMGIDCGGSCAPCKTIQQPSLLPGMGGFPTLLFLLLLLILAILLALFILYRERVYEGLAELGWLMARKRKKELLLSPEEKRTLFEELALLEQELPGLEARKAYEGLAISLRKLLSFLYDLPFEFTAEELTTATEKAELSPELQDIVDGIVSRLKLLESGRLAGMNRLLFASVLEETRLLVCMASAYKTEEIVRELVEHPIGELPFLDEIRIRLLTAHEALQFLRVEAAKTEYAAIMRAYENLAVPEKVLLYPEVRRLYHAIRYVQETME